MAAIFGLIVSGRLVQTNFEQIGETRFVTNVTEADDINHVVVFLTGSQPFPNEMGGAVYFSWPSPDGAPMWHYLGAISNSKPSAIFKISGLKSSVISSQNLNNSFLQQSEMQRVSHEAQIGISAEPLAVISGMTEAQNSAVSKQAWQLQFAEAMCESVHNYASSFSRPLGELYGGDHSAGEAFVAVGTLVSWYTTFKRKLSIDPNFWKK